MSVDSAPEDTEVDKGHKDHIKAPDQDVEESGKMVFRYLGILWYYKIYIGWSVGRLEGKLANMFGGWDAAW